MRRRENMTAVSAFGTSVLAAALRRQPLSPGKISLAWQMAAGPVLARSAEAEFQPSGRVLVRAKDARWAAEIERGRSVILERLKTLLDIPDVQLDIL